jgi:hypothetical protein
MWPEPVFLNVYGAQESILRNESASLCSLAGRYNNPIHTRYLAPIECLKFQLRESIYLSLTLYSTSLFSG